jgi:GTPase SAR1 family protein
MTETNLPINRFSYSSFVQLLRNPLIFKMKHVLGIYDTPSGMSAMIGKACHKALEYRYTDLQQPIADVIQVGMDYLVETSDAYINYGKTGSREKMLQSYTQAMQFYFKEEPTYHKIISVEEKWESECKTIYGDVLPLPMTGKADLVHQYTDNPEDVEIVDTKFTISFTDYETEDYTKIIQSMFMFHLLLATKGIKAKRMIFREIKRTANTDGSDQIRDWAIPFDHEPYFIIFYNLFNDAVKFLKNDPVFLPNLSDMFDGEQSGLIYAQGLINADMSDVEVMHKVRDVAFTSKKFIASRLESDLNKNLLPEEKIKIRLAEFGYPVEPVDAIVGASVTQYRFKISAGVRVSAIKKLKDDIAIAIGSSGHINIDIVPGTAYLGIEVPNVDRSRVFYTTDMHHKGTLKFPLGAEVNGNNYFADLTEMPHLLIAGTTGSGKSVLLNVLIQSISAQNTPKDLKLVLIDPKRVELANFGKLPHLDGKVLYEYDDVIKKLLETVDEMEKRYQLLEERGVKDIKSYNADEMTKAPKYRKTLPYIVVVIDEFADFMIRTKFSAKSKISYGSKSKAWMVRIAKKRTGKNISDYTKAEMREYLEELDDKEESNRPDANVELLITRLAQMARAVGIHLVIATQRPSTDVITGLIKSNFPSRVALTTASPVDSQIILGQPGAEKLNGKGDMLFMSPGVKNLMRLQGYSIKK